MSGIKSPSPKELVTEVLMVSHGQPSKPQIGEDDLQSLTTKVANLLPNWKFESVTMAKPKALEQKLASSNSDFLIFPVFMTRGWFTQTALPERVNDPELNILTPLGILPELPKLTSKFLSDILNNLGWKHDESCVLLAAHGSAKIDEVEECTEQFCEELRQLLPTIDLKIGYLEQDPRLSDVAEHCSPNTLLLPFFASNGGHVKYDIPKAVKQSNFQGKVLPPIGHSEFIPNLIAKTLTSANEQHITN